MKKSLLALAVLGAAVSAQAADVQMYGIVDAGISYVNQSTSLDGQNGFEDKDTFGMDSGLDSASRFGIKGTEDLGNGMSVSFKLENGFNSDTGEMSQGEDKLFGREASLSLHTGFGTVSFGRMGGLTSSAGTYDLFYSMADSFDGGKNNIVTGFKMSGRYDNMITYASPEFAGAQLFAQYSFQTEGDETDEVSNNDRYAALGMSYKAGNFGLVGVVDGYFYADRNAEGILTNAPEDDGMTVNVGANYDFGFMKLFGAFQYAKNVDDLANLSQVQDIARGTDYAGKVVMNNGMDGYALHVGATFPIASGTLATAVYYADGEEADSFNGNPEAEMTYVGVAAQYNYPLSARTDLYVGAGYSKTDLEGTLASGKIDDDMDVTQVYFGMKHSF